MCHPIKVRAPEKVLKEGFHRGYEYLIVHNGMGFRCGYVKIPPGHPWYQKGYDDILCHVHGGLTFSEADVPCDKGGPDDGWWIGFDAGHCDDGVDLDLPFEHEQVKHSFAFCFTGVIKTTEYMEEECKKLAEQAAEFPTSIATIKRCWSRIVKKLRSYWQRLLQITGR